MSIESAKAFYERVETDTELQEKLKELNTKENIEPYVKGELGYEFTLEEMQAIVGGYIELVELDGSTTMVVNEEGKLIPLSLNLEASRIFRAHHPASKDFIVGDVLVCNNNQIR